jgi:hypothetical protein
MKNDGVWYGELMATGSGETQKKKKTNVLRADEMTIMKIK